MADTPLPRNVRALGAVSFLTDVSSEMIAPLLPMFVTGVLGAGATMLGAIEGIADAIAAFLKLAAGWWSDRGRRRKPLVVLGYSIASIARPAMAIAGSAMHVLVIRAIDRVGKGIRSSPRDALIAEATPPADRGRAFGFHRAADTAGAVLGPLLAWALLEQADVPLRSVFAWAAVPAVLSVIVLIVWVRETTPSSPVGAAAAAPAPSAAPVHSASPPAPLGAPFWRYIGVLTVFTLGASTDAFILLRATDIGVPVALIPALWAVHNLVRALAGTAGGHLSDHIGRRLPIISGWALYAAVYAGFALASEAWHIWVLMVLYSGYYALTEGAEKALVADLVPQGRLGAAYGWFNFATGIAVLPASLVFGLIWDRAGAPVAFGVGAAFAAVASLGLIALVPNAAYKR
ncbi:MAG: MFS transporter [Gemmatimonadetes bacterium]|nr:MFS transporter [Gemmatimonadota bacterium]